MAATTGGAGGIRTLDTALRPYNGLANRRLQPLGHSSVPAGMPHHRGTGKATRTCKTAGGIGAKFVELARSVYRTNDRRAQTKRRINAAYLYENQSNPEFHARHNQGDPALIAEFVKEMIEDLVDPIKRKVTTSEAARFRPVPGGRDRSTPLKGEKPKSGEDMLRAHFKANR